ncbi:MAG: hypothetical protein Q4C85_05490, partial [Actinomyces sp.]|uniref:hypothetical protein n=1 Tax=Actinomyces sp. TaxID=29317 RepID=UPI0026DC2806
MPQLRLRRETSTAPATAVAKATTAGSRTETPVLASPPVRVVRDPEDDDVPTDPPEPPAEEAEVALRWAVGSTAGSTAEVVLGSAVALGSAV